MHHAALSGNKEMISLLLEAQAAVDIKDHKGKKKKCTQAFTVSLGYAVLLQNKAQNTHTNTHGCAEKAQKQILSGFPCVTNNTGLCNKR